MKTFIYLIKKLFSFATCALILVSCGGVPEESKATATEKKSFAVADVLTMVAHENDVTRTLYTKAIVGAGKKQGFKFDEEWQDEKVEAGPLPALFLRGVANDIRKGDVPLGLYLGSDYPINASNQLVGKQADLFKKIKEDRKPQHFYDEEAKVYTAMFADVAGAPACVSCHNKHPQTTKKDWKLGDVMGATTWQYPSDSLSYTEAMDVLKAYRDGTAAIYNDYLAEIADFKESEKPEVGDKWPSSGKYLPTPEVFIDSVRKLSSYTTMASLMK
ncbi:c-type heme family protein [Wenyingzhuangia sp. IMCC45533]